MLKRKENTMLQQIMTAPKEITFREVPVPEPGEKQVLVKVMNIGICGSDIHVYHGQHPFTTYPVTQGHEVSAEVVKLGEGVDGLAIGQKVTIQRRWCAESVIRAGMESIISARN